MFSSSSTTSAGRAHGVRCAHRRGALENERAPRAAVDDVLTRRRSVAQLRLQLRPRRLHSQVRDQHRAVEDQRRRMAATRHAQARRREVLVAADDRHRARTAQRISTPRSRPIRIPGDDGDYQGHVVAINLDDEHSRPSSTRSAAIRRVTSHLRRLQRACRPGSGPAAASCTIPTPTACSSRPATAEYDADLGGFNWGTSVLALRPDMTTRPRHAARQLHAGRFPAADRRRSRSLVDDDRDSSAHRGLAAAPRRAEREGLVHSAFWTSTISADKAGRATSAARSTIGECSAGMGRCIRSP